MTVTEHDKAPRPPEPEPSPDTGIDRQRGRFRFDQSRWWRWTRPALAVLMVVVATGAWLIGQTFTLFLFAPVAVAVVTVGQRALATVQGRLNTRFVTEPLTPANRPELAQALLRAVLAGLVLLSASVALLRIQAGGLPSPGSQWVLVAVPVVVFAALQLIPSRPVSSSMNTVVVIVAAFLALQLVQVHYRSSAEDAVSIAAPFEGEWFVPSGGRSTLISHHWSPLADQRYAVDFIIERNGHTHDGDPNSWASYHCWDQPILAPADGTVVTAEDGNPDIPIGESATSNAAGNVVVIDIGDNRYVQLAHLRHGSVAVTVGQPVSTGDVIGRCGNSGNSLEPHLHMQVQDSPASINEHQANGAGGDLTTYPFRFSDATHIRGGTEHPDQGSQFRRNDSVRADQ